MWLDPERKILPWTALSGTAENSRREGKRIVTTNGCFDLLHWGHIRYLAEAKAKGDVLFCGINSDASVKRLKGPSRPFWEEKIRALQLAGLESVDYVTVFEEDTPVRWLELVRPAVHVKGGDYAGKTIPEHAVMERLGGTVAFVDFIAGFSSTALLGRLAKATRLD